MIEMAIVFLWTILLDVTRLTTIETRFVHLGGLLLPSIIRLLLLMGLAFALLLLLLVLGILPEQAYRAPSTSRVGLIPVKHV